MIIQCKTTIHEIVSNFDPKIVSMASPMMFQAMKYTDDQLYSLCMSKDYTVRWNIIQAQGTEYPFSLIIFLVK